MSRYFISSIEPFPALTVWENIRSTVTICKTWVAEGIVALHEWWKYIWFFGKEKSSRNSFHRKSRDFLL